MVACSLGENFWASPRRRLALFDLIAGSIVAEAVQPGDLMLTTKLFAGLVVMLTALVFVAIAFVRKTNIAREVAMKHVAQKTSTPSSDCKLEVEAVQLTSDDLLKRMPKEQAITLVQGILRLMEESLNVPDIPAAKARLEKVLDDLKLHDEH